MAPAVCFTCWATPADCGADWPPGACQALPPSYLPQTDGAAALRYLVKLSVVPDSSERWNAWILVEGSFALGFSFLMSGAFQVLIWLLKISAMVLASRTRLSTPGRL